MNWVYVFRNAEITFALVEDQEQTDKMLEVAQSHPLLRRIPSSTTIRAACATTGSRH